MNTSRTRTPEGPMAVLIGASFRQSAVEAQEGMLFTSLPSPNFDCCLGSRTGRDYGTGESGISPIDMMVGYQEIYIIPYFSLLLDYLLLIPLHLIPHWNSRIHFPIFFCSSEPSLRLPPLSPIYIESPPQKCRTPSLVTNSTQVRGQRS